MNSICIIFVAGLLVLQSISLTARPTETPIVTQDDKMLNHSTENGTIEGKQDPICLTVGHVGCNAFCTLTGFPFGGCDFEGFCTCLFRRGSSANETDILSSSTDSYNETTTDSYDLTSSEETSTSDSNHESNEVPFFHDC